MLPVCMRKKNIFWQRILRGELSSYDLLKIKNNDDDQEERDDDDEEEENDDEDEEEILFGHYHLFQKKLTRKTF